MKSSQNGNELDHIGRQCKREHKLALCECFELHYMLFFSMSKNILKNPFKM